MRSRPGVVWTGVWGNVRGTLPAVAKRIQYRASHRKQCRLKREGVGSAAAQMPFLRSRDGLKRQAGWKTRFTGNNDDGVVPARGSLDIAGSSKSYRYARQYALVVNFRRRWSSAEELWASTAYLLAVVEISSVVI